MRIFHRVGLLVWLLTLSLWVPPAIAAESLCIEAEHLRGVRGSCLPDLDQQTRGAWGISGPGLAAEWTQGGESGWLSIACAPAEEKAVASYQVEIPEPGEWSLWVRYRDWRRQPELFAIRIEQPGRAPQTLVFGERAVIDEEDASKLLWNWAFGWDSRLLTLAKGSAKVTLLAHKPQTVHRQVDVLCLTTDREYRPVHREKPATATSRLLESFRQSPGRFAGPLAARAPVLQIPERWKPRTFRNRGFLYLWNVNQAWLEDLASTDSKRMLFPFHIDPAWLTAFREAFGGKPDVPIFSDARIVPTFHAAGPNILENPQVVQWLTTNPGRAWANMMNYIGPKPLTPAAKANWEKFSDRYVGNISGENLGYFSYDSETLNKRLKEATSRQQVLAAITEIYQAGIAAKQQTVFGDKVSDPYHWTIPCESVEMTTFAHATREWGARAVGYESSAAVPGLAMRLAFLRGSARQYEGLWATYRSAKFGDSTTIYSPQFTYAQPKYVIDNYYDVWAGAGLTWYKFDIWQQYLSGSAMFYHEQGNDEFWMPAGGSAPQKPIQLSPRGRLVDQFLKLTIKHPQRGTPVTPIAFLLDQSHGWDPNGFLPTYYGLDTSLNPDVLTFDLHARMLKEWFQVAYHPYRQAEAAVNTGVTPCYVPGIFGNIFDVLVTSPTRREVVHDYPVLVLNGDLNLSADWGQTLADYMQRGGTLVVCDGQLTGEGVAALQLPELGEPAEGTELTYVGLKGGKDAETASLQTQRFRYRPIATGRSLARAQGGGSIAATFDRGEGRLVFISIPRGLGIDRQATPLVACLLAHLRQDLLPVEVTGEVEWLLNHTETGWIISLFNPAGSRKPQHGVVVTDYTQQQSVQIRTRKKYRTANEWFSETPLPVQAAGEGSVVPVVVPAGGVRIVELAE